MMDHADKACCLAPKAKMEEKVDRRWVVDKGTKGVANVVVWVMPPKGNYFEIHKKYLKRPERVVIDQPHCAFLPFVSVYQPYYWDGKNKVETGQELIFKNSATVSHNSRMVSGNKNFAGFNPLLLPDTELNVTKEYKGTSKEVVPYHLPYTLDCSIHLWMGAKVYVFDHPYYAVTNAKGEFEIPLVPAGAEIRLMGHHDETGYVIRPELKAGRPITIKAGEKMVVNLEIDAPK
jgi:hypothetical protein